MMNILTHNFMQKCKSANFKTLKYVDFCAVFHRSIFGVSSGYLRDKTKVNFMYQRNDRLGVTLPCNSKYHHQSYQGISLYLQAIAQFLQETCDQNCAVIVNP